MSRSPIKHFPNYTIDEYGDVMNAKGIHIKPEKTHKGYLRVSLSNENVKHKRMLLHRLIAETFIPNPDNLPQVDHRNENKADNHVSNLRWSTVIDNLNHSRVIDKASEAKMTKIRCVDTGTIYESVKSAAEAFGLHHSNIVACCNGRRHTCGGMRWEYFK